MKKDLKDKPALFPMPVLMVATYDEADFFGIATGNKMPDKFARTGLHAVKSAHVNAPVIEEFPVVMECELLEIIETEHSFAIVGRIANAQAEEAVLDEKGKVDPRKLNALMFDQFRSGYYSVGDLPDMTKYDTVFLGYPIWWGDLPMPVYTFLEAEKFTGKTILPFCTHEGSGISGTEKSIADVTKADVKDGFELQGHIAQNSPDEARAALYEWMTKAGD